MHDSEAAHHFTITNLAPLSKTNAQWEVVINRDPDDCNNESVTDRLKVAGGALYRTTVFDYDDNGDQIVASVAMVFAPGRA